MANVKQTDILTGSIPRQLLAFFLPIWFGTLFQQLYNTADSIIVGNFVGSNALAAVGSSGSPIFLLIGFSQGIAVGAGVVVSQFLGAKDREGAHTAVHTSLALSAILGAILTVCGIAVSRALLTAMNTPAEVLEDAVLYMRLYFGGVLFSVVYNMAAGILNAAGNSKRSLLYLGVASITNIVLDLVLIAGCKMGVAGAAIATVVSQVASALLTLRCIIGSEGMPWHVSLDKMRIEPGILGAICTIGIPAAAQSAMYNVSNMLIQSSMNSFGTSTIAAWGVYGKIDFVFWMTINSLGIAITTFAGQNFGCLLYTSPSPRD